MKILGHHIIKKLHKTSHITYIVSAIVVGVFFGLTEESICSFFTKPLYWILGAIFSAFPLFMKWLDENIEKGGERKLKNMHRYSFFKKNYKKDVKNDS